MATKRTPLFTPLKRGAKPQRVAAFDTEGTGEPGKFTCGAVVSDDGKYTFTDPREMLAYLVSPALRGAWLFAHNLEYDLAVLTSGDLTPFSVLFTDSHILWAETQDRHGHKWRFCDSLNLFPGQSIRDLGNLVGARKLGLPDRLHELLKQGIDLSHLARQDRDLILDYCLRDAEILWLAIQGLQQELLSLGGQLKATIAGCSMDLFRRKYLVEPWPVPHPGINNLAREAYYGARTEPYRLGKSVGVNAYDINSLYPSVMRQIEYPHPGGLSLYMHEQITPRTLDQAGISKARVRVPDIDPPPLPRRVGQHLFFPTGQFTGCWTHNELRHAISRGVQVEHIEWSLVSSGVFNPFAEFVEDLYRRRLLAASDSPTRAHTFKLLLNSAYGRYGVNPEHGLSVLQPADLDVDWESIRGSEFRLMAGRPYLLMPVEGPRQPAYCNVPIAAYITAAARIRMHTELEQVIEQVCYTDTDSIFLHGELPVGSDLGDMKQIHQGMNIWVVAPKEYAVFSTEALREVKAKGVPEEYAMLYLKTGKVVFDRPVKIREAWRRNETPAAWVAQLKRRRKQVPKRSPELHLSRGLEYYPTRPWSLGELLDLVEHPETIPEPDLTRLAP
jgi:hypothetical protein